MMAGLRKHPKLRLVWKIISITFGSILILLGIISGFIPLIQGWVLVLAGLALLSPHSVWARAILDWLKRKLGRRRRETAGPAESAEPGSRRAAGEP